MKPLAFMIPAMAIGVLGSLISHPFWGILVYYQFATLRPQFIWQWTLPEVAWSFYVALAAIVATIGWRLGIFHFDDDRPLRWNIAHYGMLGFAFWIIVTHFKAQNVEVSYPYFIEYLKMFAMYFVAVMALRSIQQLWWIYLTITLTLCYIAYEINEIYLSLGYVFIFKRGYGGLDNNGAALMLAMGVPLCLFAWDGIKAWPRWFFLLCIPPFVHAVLTSYSRGAMLSLLLTIPFYLLRIRHRVQFILALGIIALIVPIMAGKEIRERFFSIEKHEMDASANSRKNTWSIGWQMALDQPIFGFGIRNSTLYTYSYGADIQGRAIHSQYLQIAADCGLVGLGWYLFTLIGFFVCISRLRRKTKRSEDDGTRHLYTISRGVEGAMIVFCIGGSFLSLESFELPYILLLLGAQAWAISNQIPYTAKSFIE